MANLNLSEFGENTFVSNADYTFVWDSANSISKKVSRNSWLNSGTLTSDAPVTISQTWGTTGTYTAFKVVANETAVANTASNLLELWAGSTPALNFRVSKSGVAQFGSGSSRAVLFDANGGIGINRADTSLTQPVVYLGFNTAGRITVVSGGTIGFSASANDVSGGNATPVTALNSDAANTLALRNGETNQKFHVYATYSNASNYRRCVLGSFDGANFDIQTEGLGTGAAGGALNFGTAGARRMTITTAGNVGIGTTAPSEKLHVLGGKVLFGDATDVTGTAGNGDLTLRAWRAPQLNMVANTSSGEVFGLNLKNGATTLAGITLNIGSGEVKIGGFWTGGYFPTFYSNNVERMRIDTGGNVGIGTTSPTSKLHVVGGNILADNYIQGQRVYSYLGTSTYAGMDTAGMFTNTGVIGFSANTGVNFTNSCDTFLVRDGEAYHLALRNGTNGQKFSVYGTYPGAAWERFTITAPTSGNVLLGTYKGTGGVARGLELQADGTTRMLITAAGAIIQRPLASVTPPDNGDLVVEATSNTTLTFKLKGTDGTVRSGTITLSV